MAAAKAIEPALPRSNAFIVFISLMRCEQRRVRIQKIDVICRSSARGYGRRPRLDARFSYDRRLERVTRLELATSSLARRCSTTELHPHFTYENRPRKKAEKYVCPAILSGIHS